MLDFKKLFKSRDKKLVTNLMTVMVAGVLLIIMGNTLFKSTPKNNKDIVQKPETVVKNNINENKYEYELEKRLESCLSLVDGVGKVKVIITLKNGREIVVAEDSLSDQSETIEEDKTGGKRQIKNSKNEDKPVIINNGEPLILKEVEPKIEGIVIVAEGGNKPEVKDSIVKASQALLGVEAHKIEVLKMK